MPLFASGDCPTRHFLRGARFLVAAVVTVQGTLLYRARPLLIAAAAARGPASPGGLHLAAAASKWGYWFRRVGHLFHGGFFLGPLPRRVRLLLATTTYTRTFLTPLQCKWLVPRGVRSPWLRQLPPRAFRAF